MAVRLISRVFVFILFSTIWTINAQAESHSEHTDEDKTLKQDFKEFRDHHLMDDHDFHLFSDEEAGTHVGFPLPVILWDGGLHVFSSSRFNHGHDVVESKGNFYKVYHGKIYKTDAEGTINYDENHHPTNAKPLDFSITKNIFLIIVISALLFWMFRYTAKSYAKNGGIPKGIGRFLEPLVLFVRDGIAKPNIGEKHYKKYMGFLLTVFFFIWLVNLFGLTPIGVNITNNIAVTFALALMVYLITTFTAKKDYWKHIFWMPGVPVPMKFILAPIELLGTIIKPFSLMIRLYANITAGHIVIMSIIGLIFIVQNWIGGSLSFVLAIALGILELLVAALQAYIFTMLSALYFGSAVEEHDHH